MLRSRSESQNWLKKHLPIIRSKKTKTRRQSRARYFYEMKGVKRYEGESSLCTDHLQKLGQLSNERLIPAK